MKRKLLLAVGIIVVLIFGIWRPVSGPATMTVTETVTVTVSETPPAVPPSAVAITRSECDNAPPARLTADSEAQVVRPRAGQVRRNLVVRDQPAGEQTGLLEPGTRFRITGDSTCDSDGLRWWPVENEALTGWSVEGFAPDDYLMEPVQP